MSRAVARMSRSHPYRRAARTLGMVFLPLDFLLQPMLRPLSHSQRMNQSRRKRRNAEEALAFDASYKPFKQQKKDERRTIGCALDASHQGFRRYELSINHGSSESLAEHAKANIRYVFHRSEEEGLRPKFYITYFHLNLSVLFLRLQSYIFFLRLPSITLNDDVLQVLFFKNHAF